MLWWSEALAGALQNWLLICCPHHLLSCIYSVVTSSRCHCHTSTCQHPSFALPADLMIASQWSSVLQALASKKLDSRRLMAQNTSLLADLAEVQHTNRDLAQQLTTASRRLAEFAGSQAAAAPASRSGTAASRSGTAASRSGTAASASSNQHSEDTAESADRVRLAGVDGSSRSSTGTDMYGTRGTAGISGRMSDAAGSMPSPR
jgi:hypothetical protein